MEKHVRIIFLLSTIFSSILIYDKIQEKEIEKLLFESPPRTTPVIKTKASEEITPKIIKSEKLEEIDLDLIYKRATSNQKSKDYYNINS